jgi:hypothetical protein
MNRRSSYPTGLKNRNCFTAMMSHGQGSPDNGGDGDPDLGDDSVWHLGDFGSTPRSRCADDLHNGTNVTDSHLHKSIRQE